MTGGRREEPVRLVDDPEVDAEVRAILRAGQRSVPSADHTAALLQGAAREAARRAWMVKLGLGALLAGAVWLAVTALRPGPASEGIPSAPPSERAVRESVAGDAGRSSADRAASAGDAAPASPVGGGTRATEAATPDPRRGAAEATSSERRRGADGARGGSAGAREDEALLLHQARTALSDAPARAWRLVRLHERRFPSSFLAEEREVLAIEALVALDRSEAARRRARRFRRRYPSSTYAARVVAAVESLGEPD